MVTYKGKCFFNQNILTISTNDSSLKQKTFFVEHFKDTIDFDKEYEFKVIPNIGESDEQITYTAILI
jgi:hypothetical protein